MRSSTKPVTSARDICWLTKYFPLFPPIFLVTKVITKITATARIVRSGLNATMEIKVTIMVKKDISAWGIAWLIICLRVSVSFV